MAIELLLTGPPHRAIHDAESLIYVLLFLCTHLEGPNLVKNPSIFSAGQNPSGISSWLSANNLKTLGHTKFSMMTAHLEVEILPHLSAHFDPIKAHIKKLCHTLFPQGVINVASPSRSVADLRDLINTLKAVLSDEELFGLATTATDRPKRPGELQIAENGWDAIPAPKKAAVGTKAKKRKSFMKSARRRTG